MKTSKADCQRIMAILSSIPKDRWFENLKDDPTVMLDNKVSISFSPFGDDVFYVSIIDFNIPSKSTSFQVKLPLFSMFNKCQTELFEKLKKLYADFLEQKEIEKQFKRDTLLKAVEDGIGLKVKKF